MAKLTMTVFDIVQQYMMSADRERQIEILADLNLCSQDDIRGVLAEAGCMLPEKKKRGRKKKTPAEEEPPQGGPGTAEEAQEKKGMPPEMGEPDSDRVEREAEREPAPETATPGTAYVDAGGICAMLAELNDADALNGMQVLADGKRVRCATITGWWDPKERRTSWALELTV